MSYADVNGLSLYYETHGSGEPVVLLHGGAGSVEMYAAMLPDFAEGRRVVAVDLQAHGRTADIDRPLRPQLMADDIAALLHHLDLPGAHLVGYSLGGAVALRTAIQHPDLVRKLTLISTPCRRTGWYPENLADMDQMGPQLAEPLKQTPLYELYSRVAPNVDDWPVLWTKMGDLLRLDYDWSAEVAAMSVPTMLVYGDADAIRPVHAVEFFELLGGGRRDGRWDGSGLPAGRLAILPGTTHYDILAAPGLAAAIIAFLDVPTPEPA